EILVNLRCLFFTGLPDPFAKVVVDGSGQCHSTDTVRNTLDPKWNQHYDLYIGKADSITISVWNHKKIHKKQGAGFLGCVRLLSNAINRLKDTGYQRLDLNKLGPNDNDTVRGQIVVSLQSRDRIGTGGPVVDCSRLFDNDLPDGSLGREEDGFRKDTVPEPYHTHHAMGETYKEQLSPSYLAHISGAVKAVSKQIAPPPPPPSISTTTLLTLTTRFWWQHNRTKEDRQEMVEKKVKRPASEYSSPSGRPLSCVVDENTPVMTPVNGAEASGPPGEQRIQERRVRSQRHRNYMSRTHLHTPPDLPEGYEQRTTQQGQVYFLHTQTGVSTWHDPRVPSPSPNGSRVAMDSQNTNLSHPPPLKDQGGPGAPQQPLSPAQLPEEAECLTVPKYKRDLVQKLKILRQELSQQQPQAGHCRIEVCREEIFEESYRQVMKMRPKDLWKRLMIKFRGEEGLDYGGVAREWLYLLSHEMLNPYYGLFQYSRDDIYTLQINPDSAVNPEHLSYFHFVGRIMGMAVFHGHYIDGGFTLPFYKQLLGKPITLD
ncbi:E3 ubiquitin-protein ligase SMURF2, partial [Nibea albiflora]